MTQQQQRRLDSGLYELRFYVPGDLVGLAIGREGNNVNEVRRMEGIAMVEFDDYSSMFRVRAEVSLSLTGSLRMEWCTCHSFITVHVSPGTVRCSEIVASGAP